MASKTKIANLALGRIGASKQIRNVDTETTREAVVTRLFMDEDILFVLRDFPWPWATAYVALALVAGSTTENAVPDWRYAYRYPTDCLYARRIAIESLGRNNPKPPPFRIGRDAQGKLIYTNEPEAVLEYTAQITDPEEFDPMFTSMLAWKVGAGQAPSLSRIKDMAETCMQMYEIEKTKAQSRALNEGQQEDPIESELVRSRD